MDAVKVLGAMLGNRAGRATGNGHVLGEVRNGVANITRAANEHKRFPGSQHAPQESLIRDSVGRHHHARGRFPSPVPSPAEARLRGRSAAPVANHVPTPSHSDDHHHDHHCRLSYRRAEMLIAAMVMAAQADGQLDQAEQDRIIAALQPLDAARGQLNPSSSGCAAAILIHTKGNS